MKENNLTKSKKILLITLPLFAGVLVTISIISFFADKKNISFSKPITPPNPKLTESPIQPALSVTTSGALPTQNQTLSIYKTNSSTNLKTIANTIATNLKLTSPPKIDTLWYSEDKSISMSYTKNPEHLTFTQTVTGNSADLINTNNALSATTKFIENIIPDLNLTPNSDKTVYLKDGTEPEETTKDQSRMAIFSFDQTIDSFNVYHNNNPESVMRLWVNSNNQVVKFTLSPSIISYNNIGIGKPISESDINNFIKNGESQIISINSSDPVLFDTITSLDINLSSSIIEYRFSKESGLIYPYYNSSSKAVLNTGKNINVQVIFPAIIIEETKPESGFGTITR